MADEAGSGEGATTVNFELKLIPAEGKGATDVQGAEEATPQAKIAVSFPGEDRETVELKDLKTEDGSSKEWSKSYERKTEDEFILGLEKSPTVKVEIQEPVKEPAEGEEQYKTAHTLHLNLCSFLLNRKKLSARVSVDGVFKNLIVELTVDKDVLCGKAKEKYLPFEISILEVEDLPRKVNNVSLGYSFYGFEDVKTKPCSAAPTVSFDPDCAPGIRKVFLLQNSKIDLTELHSRMVEHPFIVEMHLDPAEQDFKSANGEGKDEKVNVGGAEKPVEGKDSKSSHDSPWYGPALTKSKAIYGIAEFRLEDIFQGSTVMEYAGELRPEYPAIREAERNLRDSGSLLGFSSHHGNKKLLNPFNSLDADSGTILQTEMRISIRLLCSMPKKFLNYRHRFSRYIIVLRYSDTKILQELNRIIIDAAKKHLNLPDTRTSTIQSYKLTKEQCSDPKVDVVTGFQLVDDDFRYIVLEGASGKSENFGLEKEGDKPGGNESVEVEDELTTIERIAANIPLHRRTENSIETERSKEGPVAVLYNPDVTFRHRLYGGFNLELKSLKLTQKLSNLEEKGTTFNTQNARERYLTCIKKLISLKDATKHGMKKARMESVFPSVDELLSLEKKFGKEVLDQDIGLPPRELPVFVSARVRKQKDDLSREPSNEAAEEDRRQEMSFEISANLDMRRTLRDTRSKPWTEEVEASRDPLLDVNSGSMETLELLAKLHAPVIRQSSQALAILRDEGKEGKVTKVQFVRALKVLDGVGLSNADLETIFDLCMPSGDYMDIYAFRRTVAMAKDAYDRNRIQILKKKKKKDIDVTHDPNTPVYMYSGQRLNYRTLQARKLLQKQSSSKQFHQTYNPDFFSQSVDFTNPHDDMLATQEEERKKRIHPKGFQYYVPKDPRDYRIPTKTLHHTKVEELNNTRYQDIRKDAESVKLRHRLCPRCGFKTLLEREKCKGCGLGFNSHGKFSNEGVFGYKDQKRAHAPSIHEPDIESKLHNLSLKEKEEWRTKLKGDPSFMTYLGGVSKQRPSQLDKNETILKNEPRKTALKNAHVEHMPHNTFASEPMFPNSKRRGFAKVQAEKQIKLRDRFNRSLRQAQKNYNPVHKKAAAPIEQSAKTGPKWGK